MKEKNISKIGDISNIEEQSVKSTRLAYVLLLTVCLASFIFSFSPIEESINKNAIDELNALEVFDIGKLPLHYVQSDSVIKYNEIKSLLREYGFVLLDDSKGNIFQIIPEVRSFYLDDLIEYVYDDITNYIANTKELEILYFKYEDFGEEIRKIFTVNKQKFSEYPKKVILEINSSSINFVFKDEKTIPESYKTEIFPINPIKTFTYKISIDIKSQIYKDPKLSKLITKKDDSLIFLYNVRQLYDQIKSDNPKNARSFLARNQSSKENKLEVFGLSIPQKIISWLIPILIFCYSFNLLAHVVHLEKMCRFNSSILYYPWIGIMPGIFANIISITTLILFPVLSLFLFFYYIIISQNILTLITFLLFGILSIICQVMTYSKLKDLKQLI